MGCASSTAAAEHAHPDFFDNYVLAAKIGKGSYAQVRVAKKNNNAKIGKGSYAQVRVADKKNNFKELPRTRAVKILDLEPGKDALRCKWLQNMARNEVDVWKSVGCHDHCVRLHETFFDDHACYMVMEKCESSLFVYVERMPEINERTVGGILIQMLKGIEHVHSVKVVHRDIKPQNFLIGGYNGKVVKLCDFGLARMLLGKEKLVGEYGTAPFMAPEMLQKSPYAHEVDIWSFGVTAYTLLFGSLPYEPRENTTKAMKEAILVGHRPQFKVSLFQCTLREQTCSDSATAFVKAMLHRDPKNRPTASEALHLPFMKATMQNNHMTGVELPFLRATVTMAERFRVMGTDELQEKGALDTYMNARHFAKHDGVLPEFDPVFLHESMTKHLSSSGLVSSKLQKNSGVIGHLPSNCGRFQSNPREETSATTSCGTSGIDSETTSKSSSTT